MIARILSAVLLCLAALTAGAQPGPRNFSEGIDFFRLGKTLPVSTGEQIEVIEFFSYACIHCAEIEPHMTRWKETQPANVKLVLMPAVFNPDWEIAARAYFAAEAMGVLAQTHKATFDARFIESKPLTSIEQYADLYASKGVDRAKFLAVANSFGINAKIARSKKLAVEYDVTATPTVVVDGKYRLELKNLSDAPDLINFVAARAANERTASTPGGSHVP